MTEATPLVSEQITQEDREAAASYLDCGTWYEDSNLYPNSVREGHDDHFAIVQAFARHRIAALSASPAPSGQGVSGKVERLVNDLLAWAPKPDDRVKPLLLAEASRRDAADWNYEDAENVIAFLLAAPAPSCAPGEVERLRAEFARLHEAARGCEFDLTPTDGPIAQLTLFVHENGDAILAALSPQGLDAKEGGPKLNEHDAYRIRKVAEADCGWRIPAPFDEVADHLAAIAFDEGVKRSRPATPSQRLDAATVERCAQVADERATARRAEEAKERLPGGDIETAVVCARVASTAESIAAAIRALATEPHQHGGTVS